MSLPFWPASGPATTPPRRPTCLHPDTISKNIKSALEIDAHHACPPLPVHDADGGGHGEHDAHQAEAEDDEVEEAADGGGVEALGESVEQQRGEAAHHAADRHHPDALEGPHLPVGVVLQQRGRPREQNLVAGSGAGSRGADGEGQQHHHDARPAPHPQHALDHPRRERPRHHAVELPPAVQVHLLPHLEPPVSGVDPPHRHPQREDVEQSHPQEDCEADGEVQLASVDRVEGQLPLHQEGEELEDDKDGQTDPDFRQVVGFLVGQQILFLLGILLQSWEFFNLRRLDERGLHFGGLTAVARLPELFGEGEDEEGEDEHVEDELGYFGDESLRECARGGPQQHAGDDDRQQFVVHQRRLPVRVLLEDDRQEVGQGSAHHQRLRESRGLIEFVLQQHHEDEYLEDAHGVAGDVAEGGGDSGADVDGGGVGGEGEDVVVEADGVHAVEERLAVRVLQAPVLQHIALILLELHGLASLINKDNKNTVKKAKDNSGIRLLPSSAYWLCFTAVPGQTSNIQVTCLHQIVLVSGIRLKTAGLHPLSGEDYDPMGVEGTTLLSQKMQVGKRVSGVASALLWRSMAYSFCVDWAPMDPRKHTTMNHNPHAMYLDVYEYGHYPDWVHICSKAPSTYQPQVLSVLADALSARYSLPVTPELLLSKQAREWSRFLSKDLKVGEQFHELYPALLGRLASGIFVKESRLTWVLEQKVRHDFTLAAFDLKAPATVGDFLEQYNEHIEELVLMSNMGFAAEIDQAESALEKHENQQHYNYATGVQELKNLKPEHDNLFNRLLAYFH